MVTLDDKQFEVFIPQGRIQEALRSMAAQLDERLSGRSPILVGVLKGSAFVTCDLARIMTTPVELNFIRVASYDGTESTGEVKQVLGIGDDISSRHVVLVEDIVDTGRTLQYLTKEIHSHGVASLTTVSLLDKPSRREVEVHPDIVGIEIEDRFVVGVGLDYNEKGRDLPDLYALRD